MCEAHEGDLEMKLTGNSLVAMEFDLENPDRYKEGSFEHALAQKTKGMKVKMAVMIMTNNN